MPRGAKPGERRGGRAKGTPNKKTAEAMQAAQEAGRVLAEHLGDKCFAGDAHALAMALYKDTTQPIEIRLEAMKAALPYEKPRLAAVEHSGAIGTTQEDGVALLKRLSAEEAAKSAKPESETTH
jgi:hypothetical protein